MQCVWCGKETPDNSAYCEQCGHKFEDTGDNPASFEDAAEDAGEDAVEDIGEVDEVGEEEPSEPTDAAQGPSESDGEVFTEPEAGKADSPDDGLELENTFDIFSETVPAGGTRPPLDGIRRSVVDDPLVDPPTPPLQPKLSKGRVFVVGLIGVLFAAAVILLVWAILMRVFGL